MNWRFIINHRFVLKPEKLVLIEALLRWHHPELGMIPPKVIIPLAEQTGLINPIGEWVLETACHQNKQWQDGGLPPIVSVLRTLYQLFF